MADPLSADRLVAALRAEGVHVVEHDGWRTHNRNHKGPWGPVNGVVVHHTVSSGTISSVALCYTGYAELPGPLCHGVIPKDGSVHLVGNGRANHAGGGDPGVLSAVVNESYSSQPPAPHEHQGSGGAVDGNAHFYGFECVNLGDGKDPWPAAQVEAIVRVAAAICRAHGWTAKSVIGHKEWSDWKNDPRGPGMPSMPDLRSRIAARLAGPATTNSTPPPPSEEALVATASDVKTLFKTDNVLSSPDGANDPQGNAYWTAESYLRYGFLQDRTTQSLVKQLATKVDGIGSVELDDAQLAALADKVAAAPGLADAIAEKVAQKLADRLAE
ncbi:N-acetylmuramoyl-L-alanine amidase [Streptomyces sp. bgisy154]|uniref:N-acetylmuramoyl-L-alanine amidase n=1 Tax=Streptomyces sp. bgisy154 TaxID=3413794 RepID=UPI003D72A42D